jgi:hypothetical protein
MNTKLFLRSRKEPLPSLLAWGSELGDLCGQLEGSASSDF